MLHQPRLELLNRHGVPPIVLDGHTKLSTLYPESSVLGDEDCRGVLVEVETRRQNPMIWCVWV
jgi:hypothetical protein